MPSKKFPKMPEMLTRNPRLPLYAVLGVIVVLALVAFSVSVSSMSGAANLAATETQAASATQEPTQDPTKDPTPPPAKAQDTAVGHENNTDPVGDPVRSWNGLVDQYDSDSDYWTCLKDRIGVSRSEAKRYAKLEDMGANMRFVSIFNSEMTAKQARAKLKDQGETGVNKLPVRRYDYMSNTASVADSGCKAFNDRRGQVRIELGIPVNMDALEKHLRDKDDLDMDKELRDDIAVSTICTNPQKLLNNPPPARKPTETPTPAPTSSKKPEPTKDPEPSKSQEPSSHDDNSSDDKGKDNNQSDDTFGGKSEDDSTSQSQDNGTGGTTATPAPGSPEDKTNRSSATSSTPPATTTTTTPPANDSTSGQDLGNEQFGIIGDANAPASATSSTVPTPAP